MKNKRIERALFKARQYTKTALASDRYDSESGLIIYHLYTDRTGKKYRTKGYWDDVSFKMGSYYITVNWTHPRFKYEDSCEQLSFDFIKDNFPNLINDIDSFYAAWKSKEAELLQTSDIEIKCDFEVLISDWSRRINICYPIEVIDKESLVDLVTYIKNCLKNSSLFNHNWKEYTYNNKSWLEEN